MTDLAHQTTDSRNIFGFWVYLMTDGILFATLFATFVVLRGTNYGGQAIPGLFSLPFVLTETIILLTSSFSCGLGLLAAANGSKKQVLTFFGITFMLGLAFLALELNEFSRLVSEGHGWRVSAFLSGFFTLVGTHGLHITAGLLWIIVMLARIARRGLTSTTKRRLTMLGLFWHFLDIVWIFIFTIVYLLGAVKT